MRTLIALSSLQLHVLISSAVALLSRSLVFSAIALLCVPWPVPARAQDRNTREGQSALAAVTSGDDNSAFGFEALTDDGDGSANTATGSSALSDNISGSNNTADGYSALILNRSSDNTAVGANALVHNTTGSQNTALGSLAMFGNGGYAISGTENTATGFQALSTLSTGSCNTATGSTALFRNNDGFYNTADGWQALYTNASGYYNTASGAQALFYNKTGSSNTGIGAGALTYNDVGVQNTAIGASALFLNRGSYNTATGANTLHANDSGSGNVADGLQALFGNTSGSNNLALGYKAGFNLTTGSNNIVIGATVLGKAGDANKITIGKQGTQTATFIAGISGKTVATASAVAVFVDNTGKLGTVKSSARFKDEIKPMDTSSEGLLKLKPVTFRYKKELDPDGVRQFGLIAEQVEEVNPDLVVRDENGKLSTVRYEAVNAMLLNEFLKEHRKVEEQRAYFGSKLAEQQKQIETLTAGLQKVTARVETDNSAQRIVSGN